MEFLHFYTGFFSSSKLLYYMGAENLRNARLKTVIFDNIEHDNFFFYIDLFKPVSENFLFGGLFSLFQKKKNAFKRAAYEFHDNKQSNL